MKRSHFLRKVIPLLILLWAYTILTTSLDWQSFWIDEIQAFDFIDHPFIETVKLLITPHDNGPLYFILLWVWQRITGPSDFSLRYLSVLCSILSMALLWWLSQTWFSKRVGKIAMMIFACAPFAIWYGQEAKMYALHMMLAILSTVYVTKAIQKQHWHYWLAYGVTLNLVGYSHLFGAFFIAAQGVLVLITTYRQWRILRAYLITMILVGLPYLPVIYYAMNTLSMPSFTLTDNSKGFVTFPHMLQEFAAEFTMRVPRTYLVHINNLVIACAIIIILGLISAWQRDRRWARWILGLLILPALIYYPISFKIPVFTPKYLSASFPFFVMSAALAVDFIYERWRWLAKVFFVGIITFLILANIRIISDPVYQRTDWKLVSEYLNQMAQPGDAVVGFADYIHRAINRYYHGPLPVYRFRANPYDPEEYYRDWLQDKNDHHAFWLVLHQDQAMAPGHILREVASSLYPLITEVYPNKGQVAIIGYSLKWQSDSLPEESNILDAPFENGLTLAGCSIDDDVISPKDEELHPPSSWIHVITFWQKDINYSPSIFVPYVHLIDENGGIWGGELQRSPTVFDFDPPQNWEAGTIVEAHYDVNLNPVTPPGQYHLVVGLTDGNGQTISLMDDQLESVCTEITIIK